MEFDPFDIRAQQRKDADDRHEVAIEERTEADDWAWLMSSKRGRRIMRSMLDFCGVYKSSFTGNSETYFREGQRNVGLRMLSMVQINAPEFYIEMIKEAKDNA